MLVPVLGLMEKLKTSLVVDKELWTAAKVKCLKGGLELSQYVEDLVRADLKKKP